LVIVSLSPRERGWGVRAFKVKSALTLTLSPRERGLFGVFDDI